MRALTVLLATLLVLNAGYAAARYAYHHQAPRPPADADRIAALEKQVHDQQQWIEDHRAVEGDTMGQTFARYQEDARPRGYDPVVAGALSGSVRP